MHALYHVLYVDDEPALLEIAKLILERTGEYAVTTTTSAVQALALLPDTRFDVIVSDYQMPDIDGIGFLKQVRARFGDLPFILFTGKGREEVVIEALNNGADFYLQKGGDIKAQFAELAHKITKAVEQRLAKEALSESQKRTAEIIEFLPDATFAIDTEGIVIAWNHAIEVMTGIQKSEMLNRGNYEYSIPFYHERRPILIDLVFRDDERVTARYPFIERAGDKIISEITIPHFYNGKGAYLWFTASPLYDSQGRISGAIESIRNITDRKRVEEALQKSELFNRGLIDNLPDYIVIYNAEGVIRYVNPAAAKIMGYTVGEVVGRSVLSFVAGEYRTVVTQKLLERQETGEATPYEIEILSREGGRYTVLVRGTYIPYQNAPAVLLVLFDITTRKHAERALIDSEERYRTLVASVAEAIVLQEKTGKILTWNTAAEQLFGATSMDMLGHTATSRTWETIREDGTEFPESAHPSIHTLATGESCKNVVMGIRNASGNLCWVNINTNPLFREGETSPYAVVITLLDITERKQAVERLRESERRLTGIVNFLPDAVLVLDRKGTVIAWNRAMEDLTGVKAEDMLGTGDYEYAIPFYGCRRPILVDYVLSPDTDAGTYYSKIKREGETLVVEAIDAHPRSRTVVLWARAAPLYDRSGNVYGAVESIRDMTEHKQMEDAISEVNRKLHLLSSITRHDILNQLLALRGYLELSQESIHDPDRLAAFIKKGEHAAATIEEQITFTRDYQEMGVKAPGWQSVREVVAQAQGRLFPQGVSISVDCTGLEVFADPLFFKVFYNLFDNAVRHGGAQLSSICISAAKAGGTLTLVCEDDGVGIYNEDKSRLFTRGFGKNTGLGLFLSREILSITGITITENGVPGKGARFEMVVPERGWRVTDAG